MPQRDSSIAVVVTVETVLVFLLGVFGNKISNLINISPTILLSLTFVAIVAAAFISYKKYTYKSKERDAAQSLIPSRKQIAKAFEHLPFLKPVPKPAQLSYSELEKVGEAALTKSLRLSVLVGAILFPLVWWLNGWLLLICIVSAITIDFISIIPVLKLPSGEEGFGRLYEVFGVLFLMCVVSFLVGLFSSAVLLLLGRLFGIPPINQAF